MAEEKTIISVKNPTPPWANWVFRSVLIAATTLSTAIVNAPGISEGTQLNIVYWSSVITTAVWAISRAIGIKIEPLDTEVTKN